MYWDVEVTPEDEVEMIRKIAEKMHSYGMDVPVILFLETVKPLTYIGSQMGCVFVSPFLPVFGEEIGLSSEKLLRIFEKRENVEKLIKAVEELTREEEEQKKAEKVKKLDAKRAKIETGEIPKKKGWRRLLPF